MNKNTQSELWEKMAFGLPEMTVKCQTPDMKKNSADFEKMSGKFADTLNDEQRNEFEAVLEAVDTVSRNSYEMGVLAGLTIAKELQTFLNHPKLAMQQSSARESARA